MHWLQARFLFKCDSEVTIELVKVLKISDACSDDTIRKLLSTPKMKSHIQKQEPQLSRIGLKTILGNSRSNNLKDEESQQVSRIPYGLLRRYSRETLYSEVWEQPMKILCLKYGISDVALAKVCKKLSVPLPGRGYWAKKSAGYTVKKRPELPVIEGIG